MTDAEESLLSLAICHSATSVPLRHFSPDPSPPPPPRQSSPTTSGEAEAGLLPRVPPPTGKKTSNILLLSHTWLLGLISIVNSFTSRRFEGSSPGSPAQQLQCHANCTLHTAHCTLHTARCTLYGTHCMLNSAQWTVRCTWLLPTAYTMHTKQRKLNSVQWTHCTLRSAL